MTTKRKSEFTTGPARIAFMRGGPARIAKQGGFTLIELLVTVAIISLLSSIVITSLSDTRAKARDAIRIQNMREIQKALELYRADNGVYPPTESEGTSDCGMTDESFEDALQILVTDGYIPFVPNEPTHPNNEYPSCYFYVSHPETNTSICEGFSEESPYVLLFTSEQTSYNLPHIVIGNTELPNTYCITTK